MHGILGWECRQGMQYITIYIVILQSFLWDFIVETLHPVSADGFNQKVVLPAGPIMRD